MRRRARLLLHALNACRDDEESERARLLRELLPKAGQGLWIETPFHCDYGAHITLGENVFFNFDCVVLDVAPVTIGSNVLFGPAVELYTATHPLNAEARHSGLEAGKPITIGDDCWIGGGVVVNPGVTFGARSVIGAGSVVTRDMPADVFAAGNPCRVIRAIDGYWRRHQEIMNYQAVTSGRLTLSNNINKLLAYKAIRKERWVAGTSP